jgi:hypothetical protein
MLALHGDRLTPELYGVRRSRIPAGLRVPDNAGNLTPTKECMDKFIVRITA